MSARIWRHAAWFGVWAWIFSGGGGAAYAQIGKHFDSIEAMVARADLVVRGSIVKLTQTVTVPRDGFRGGTTWPDGFMDVTFTRKVQEVLKGRKIDDLTLMVETRLSNKCYEQWKEAQTEFFYCGASEQKLAAGGPRPFTQPLVRLGPPVAAERGFRAVLEPPIFTMDF